MGHYLEDVLLNGTKEDFKLMIECMEEALEEQTETVFLTETRVNKTYTRRIKIPAGFLIIGKPRREKNAYMMLSGEMITRKSNDEKGLKLSGFNMGWDQEGEVRIGITQSETIWMTLHNVPLEVQPGEEEEYILGIEVGV